MANAYGWAFRHPLREVYYNMATVGLGVFVATFVGLVEYLQVLSSQVDWRGGFWDWLNSLNFEVLGYVIVAAFLLLWMGPSPSTRCGGSTNVTAAARSTRSTRTHRVKARTYLMQ